MGQVIHREIRRRSVFGHVIKWIFILFNLLMAFLLLKGCAATADGFAPDKSDAELVGHTIGAGLGVGFILFAWLAGAVILGLGVMFTRGQKVIVEEERP